MVIKSDIPLRGEHWIAVTEALNDILAPAVNYNTFMLALSLGIMYDKRLVLDKSDEDDIKVSVPRNVINNNDNGKLDFYFQAAVLSTTTESYTEEERLEYAFGEETSFNKIGFLLEFANFGASKLYEKIGDSTLETMENIKNFFVSSVEGRNLEIEALPDDLLLED